MSTTLETLAAEVLKLPPGERSKLLDRVIESLDADADLDAAWEREADRREAELVSGAIEALDGVEMMTRLRARIG